MKGTGSRARDRIQFFTKLHWFFNCEDGSLMRYCICHLQFPAVKLNNAYWRLYHILHFPIVFQNGLNYIPIDFNEQAKSFHGSQINFTFSPRPLSSLLAILKNILELEEWTKGIKSSASEIIESDRDRKEFQEMYLQSMVFFPYVFTQTAWEMAMKTYSIIRGAF